MRILIIGSGGREHALSWKLHQSIRRPKLFIAPGNGGTSAYGTNIPIDAGDIKALIEFIVREKIDFVIPGSELPLVRGIVNACKKIGVLCFGPDAYAAQLEGSKVFSKELMKKVGIPTADFAVFHEYEAAVVYIKAKELPLVIKADGLAAGKGVIIAKTEEEALTALSSMMISKDFGEAGATVIIEDTLFGEEASFLAFCQGESVIALPSAQDHKAAYDNDAGPNTGGMGAYSPAPILPEQQYEHIINISIRPILKELKKQGHPFSGILYVGLMMTADGPKVLEYNVRFGDPECQPLLMRLDEDILDSMLACAEERLVERSLALKKEAALCVVIAAEGYPGNYPKGMVINGISSAEAHFCGAVKIFEAGTKTENQKTTANGGRVLGVTALGKDLKTARENAYGAIGYISMAHAHYRHDIGNKGI